MSNVIEFSVIPIKPADRVRTHAFTAHLVERDVSELSQPHPEWRHYQCTDCGQEDQFRRRRPDTAVYCRCGAEMRPVEGK